jgi:gluconate:H+ symporter, GntP family
MAHSLVPPTPGPLFVARELQVEPGLMMAGGLVVGVMTSALGYFYALWANARWPVALRERGDVSLEVLERMLQRPVASLPPLWMSLLPVLLPVVLIAGRAWAPGWRTEPGVAGWVGEMFARLGEPNMALMLAALAALGMTGWQRRSLVAGAEFIPGALGSAGMIILITSAGGAFGGVLQQTGIGSWLQGAAMEYRVGLLPLAFGLTTLVRTAQGSATVAMITAVGMLGGLGGEALGYHPLYLALAIGCGSKPFPWLNDSGFWVIAKMSGLTERETIRCFSVMISLMGLGGLVLVMVAARLLPLV